MPDINTLTVSGRDLGKLFRIGDRRVRQLAEAGVFVRAGRGEYELVASVQGFFASLERKSDPDDLRAERTALVKAQRRRIELANRATEATAETQDRQSALVQFMATHLLLRIRPLSTWLHHLLRNHGIQGRSAELIAGEVHNWLVGARAEIERDTAVLVTEARRRGVSIRSYHDLQDLIGREDEPDDMEPADG